MLEQNYIAGETSVNIASSIEQAIASGRALPGEALPPVRSVAAARGVSAATVTAAYRLLRDRGLVIADGRRGTRVRPAATATAAPAIPPGVRDLASGNPDPEFLPSLDSALRKVATAPRLYGDEVNHPLLVDSARRHFALDGVPSSSLSVVSGALDGIERVLREHLRPGDRVLVEDPCFTGITDILAALALTPVGLEVDDEGIDPRALRTALKRPAAALIVTPRAQNPTGAAFTPRRQRMLRAVLKRERDLLLIEDDHAGPVAGAPYATLVNRDHPRWAVVRSVSKSLGPDLRVAVMSSDATTAARIARRQTIGIRWVSHVLQQIVVALWRDRAIDRKLERAEKTYTERRQALIEALRTHGIAAHGRSGMNVWIPVPQESAVVQGLMQRGWAVQAGERYRLSSPPAIRVTTASLRPHEAKSFAADLAAILAPAGRSSLS